MIWIKYKNCDNVRYTYNKNDVSTISVSLLNVSTKFISI